MKRESFTPIQAQQVAGAFAKHQVDYMFIGKSGAILLGYPGTTQDVDVFPRKDIENGKHIVSALTELGFEIDSTLEAEIVRGKAFVQIKNGPFDIDLVFAPDGIESYAAAARRAVMVEDLPVCHPDDIIRSKEKAGRLKDRESLPRLRAFRDWWLARRS